MAKRRSDYAIELRGSIDRRTSRRQSQGWSRTRNHADEKSTAVFLDQGGRRTSWKVHLGTGVMKDCATRVRDDVFASTPSPMSVRGLLLYAAWNDLRVETGDLVCAFMQADTSCEVFARPPTGQVKEGWIWRLHGAMNVTRRASRDSTEFLAGVLAECMGHTWKTGAMPFCAQAKRDTSCISCRRPAHLRKTSDIWTDFEFTLRSWWLSREARHSILSYLRCTCDLNTVALKNPDASDLL